MAFLIPVFTRHPSSTFILIWTAGARGHGSRRMNDVGMTTVVMAPAAGKIHVVDGGAVVKKSLATAIFPATRTSNSNNTQQ
jgi:hypothetical protein